MDEVTSIKKRKEKRGKNDDEKELKSDPNETSKQKSKMQKKRCETLFSASGQTNHHHEKACAKEKGKMEEQYYKQMKRLKARMDFKCVILSDTRSFISSLRLIIFKAHYNQ